MSLAGVTSRMLARQGRPMVLRRRTGTGGTFVEATVQGYLMAFSPQEIIGAVQIGDARVTVGPGAGTLTEPKPGDMLHIEGKAWRLMGAMPRYVGATLAGWTLWVRGG